MLDQSFSAHNFDIIYGIESRKGNIDIHSMPTKYLDIVKKTKDIKSIIKELKNKEDERMINQSRIYIIIRNCCLNYKKIRNKLCMSI